jgi:hypothetical protein
METFIFYRCYGVLICKPCRSAIPPSSLQSHIKSRHNDIACYVTGLDFNVYRKRTKPAEMLVALLQEKYSLLDPRHAQIPTPLPTEPPVPELKLYRGFRCSRCPKIMTKSRYAHARMQTHFNKHRIIPRKKGKPGKVVTVPEDEGSIYSEVSWQRFLSYGAQSSFFEVGVPSAVQELVKSRLSQPSQDTELLKALVEEQLHHNAAEREIQVKTYCSHITKTEVSPWLEMTRWPRFFDGLNMEKVAPLAYGPNPITEPLLVILSESVDRVDEQAHRSIREDKISVYDQAKINNFISSQSSRHDRMIMVKLQKETFRAYKSLWKNLLCFVYRTSQPSPQILLPHKFTSIQLICLDRAMALSQELLSLRRLAIDRNSDFQEGTGLLDDLDKSCLHLCISLLDHTLRGDHFESVVLSFLGVLGIDGKPGGVFRSPMSYSPDLSKFIKIAQMLVVQRAVSAADDGEVEHPSDLLDEMRERFMMRGSRTAFDWACRLRAYAKKVVSNTTSLGYITWSEDAQTVFYRDASFSMDSLRSFVAAQVRKAQKELEGLLLLHTDEKREDVVPTFFLHRLQDDPSNSQKGWNFLKDPRNADQLQEGGERWLLDRVLENDWLRDEMLHFTKESQIHWNRKAVQAYFAQVDQFLETLLLLFHVTLGQPARGSELLSLQHCNTAQGHHRGTFIEDGIVGTVTSYHKGYNITGSTKIIHRYLPKEVSELFVYYLWLVLPFWEKLDVLVNKRKDPPSTFLWPKGSGSWDTNRLSKVIAREAAFHLDTKLNILSYRHLAIAISRQHLPCGGFKRDYGVDKKLADEQASHGSWIAGTVYARGLQEAPGHVKMRSMEYRSVSRAWHSFLGFRVYLGARKRPLAEDQSMGNAQKRVRTE